MLEEKLKMMNGVLENGNYQLGQFQFAVLVPNRVWVRHLVRAIRFGGWLLLFYLALYRGV